MMLQARNIKPLMLLGLLLIFFPQGQAITTTQTRYLRNRWITPLDSMQSYALGNQTDIDGSVYVQAAKSTSYNGKTQIALDIYRANYTDFQSSYELFASKVAVMERNTNAQGYQTAYWNCSELNLTRTDYLYIEIWARFQTSSTVWTTWYLMYDPVTAQIANFITESLGMTKLIPSQWNATFYTYRNRIGFPTNSITARVYFGNSTYLSQIENIQIDDGIPASFGLKFSSGVIFMGVIAAAAVIIALAAGLSLKKKR